MPFVRARLLDCTSGDRVRALVDDEATLWFVADDLVLVCEHVNAATHTEALLSSKKIEGIDREPGMDLAPMTGLISAARLVSVVLDLPADLDPVEQSVRALGLDHRAVDDLLGSEDGGTAVGAGVLVASLPLDDSAAPSMVVVCGLLPGQTTVSVGQSALVASDGSLWFPTGLWSSQTGQWSGIGPESIGVSGIADDGWVLVSSDHAASRHFALDVGTAAVCVSYGALMEARSGFDENTDPALWSLLTMYVPRLTVTSAPIQAAFTSSDALCSPDSLIGLSDVAAQWSVSPVMVTSLLAAAGIIIRDCGEPQRPWRVADQHTLTVCMRNGDTPLWVPAFVSDEAVSTTKEIMDRRGIWL